MVQELLQPIAKIYGNILFKKSYLMCKGFVISVDTEIKDELQTANVTIARGLVAATRSLCNMYEFNKITMNHVRSMQNLVSIKKLVMKQALCK